MRLRTLTEIFPAWMEQPDEDDLRRECDAYLYDCRMIENVTDWVNREDCPYKREAKAVIMIQLVRQHIKDDNWNINTAQQEDIEDEFKRIIRRAQYAQGAEEIIIAEKPKTNQELPQRQAAEHLEKTMSYLVYEIEQIKERLNMQTSVALPRENDYQGLIYWLSYSGIDWREAFSSVRKEAAEKLSTIVHWTVDPSSWGRAENRKIH